MHRLLSLLLCAWMMALPAYADVLTIPYSFSPGTTINSSKVNSNFNAGATVINGNLDDNNIKSGASIAMTKLNLTQELPILRSAGSKCFSAGVTGDTNPRVSLYSDGTVKFGAGGASALDLMIERQDANTLAVRDAGDTTNKNFQAGALTLNTPLPVASGGTGLSSVGSNGTVLGVSGGVLAYISAGSSWTMLSKSSGFTANDPANSFYLITASSAIAVTLPASPADGRVYKFQRVSGSALITFTANGAETIRNCDAADTTLILDSGCVELIAVTGGWVVT